MTKVIVRMQEGDAVVNGSVERLKKATGATVIKLTEIAKVSNLKKGDTLILLAHGSTSKLGGKTPGEIAELLSKADLKSGITIDLVACNSGTGGSPLALELKTQLVSKKIVPASVSGGAGYMAVLSAGDTISAKKTGTNAQGKPTYSQVTKGKEKQQTPWGERTRNVNPTYRTGG